jgi:glycosyltransferase involved in cell wall biosynthesis
LKEYADKDSRLIIIKQKNSGAGAARNAGLDKAQGEYLSFLDSDDFFELDMFEKMYEKAKNTDADITLCSAAIYDNISRKKWIHLLNINNLGNMETFSYKDIPNNIFSISRTEAWSKFFKSSFIIDNNIKFQNLKTCNDVYFSLLSLSLAKKIAYINQPFVNYRKNMTSSTTSSRGNFYQSIFIAFEELKSVLIEKNIFEELKNSFYGKFVDCIGYEYQFISDKNKKIFLKRCKKDIPKVYFENLTKKIDSRFISKVFSIYNETNHKVIRIFGLKIKLRKEKIVKFKKITTKFLEKIFSVKNENIYKVIRIFGIKIKFKSRYKILLNRFDLQQKQIDKNRQDIEKITQNINNGSKQ